MPMEIDLGPEAEQFRDELRQWLEANRPDDLDDSIDPRAADVRGRPGGRRRGPRSCTTPATCASAWPKEYGGRGLSGVEVAVLNEEFAARARARA